MLANMQIEPNLIKIPLRIFFETTKNNKTNLGCNGNFEKHHERSVHR
jgi:hypothetical protein